MKEILKIFTSSAELLHFNSPLPFSTSIKTHQIFLCLLNLSVQTFSALQTDVFLSVYQQYNSTSPWYWCISLLNLTYNWSHVAIKEHSDVPTYQKSWADSQNLYIQFIIGVLYSTVTYVWAQKYNVGIGCDVVLIVAKRALLLTFTLSYLYHMIFKDIYYSILLFFYVSFYLFWISSNYNQ